MSLLLTFLYSSILFLVCIWCLHSIRKSLSKYIFSSNPALHILGEMHLHTMNGTVTHTRSICRHKSLKRCFLILLFLLWGPKPLLCYIRSPLPRFQGAAEGWWRGKGSGIGLWRPPVESLHTTTESGRGFFFLTPLPAPVRPPPFPLRPAPPSQHHKLCVAAAGVREKDVETGEWRPAISLTISFK